VNKQFLNFAIYAGLCDKKHTHALSFSLSLSRSHCIDVACHDVHVSQKGGVVCCKKTACVLYEGLVGWQGINSI